MQPIVTDGVCLTVSLSFAIVNHAEKAELIEMLFGMWALVVQGTMY